MTSTGGLEPGGGQGLTFCSFRTDQQRLRPRSRHAALEARADRSLVRWRDGMQDVSISRTECELSATPNCQSHTFGYPAARYEGEIRKEKDFRQRGWSQCSGPFWVVPVPESPVPWSVIWKHALFTTGAQRHAKRPTKRHFERHAKRHLTPSQATRAKRHGRPRSGALVGD